MLTIPVAFDCGKRIPPQLRTDVPGCPLAALDGTLAGLGVALDCQTGRLDQSNDTKQTSLWIVDQCEAEKQAAIDKAQKKKWWQIR